MKRLDRIQRILGFPRTVSTRGGGALSFREGDWNTELPSEVTESANYYSSKQVQNTGSFWLLTFRLIIFGC